MPAGDITRAYPVNRTAGNLTRTGVTQVDSEITSTLLPAINSLRNRYAGASAPSPASQYMIWYDTVNAVQKMYDGAVWNITTSPTLNAPTSNVVLSGQVDSVGVPVLFIAGTGRACSLQATAEPAVIAFMAGLDINGGIDSIGRLTADAANFWSGLPQSQTSYLYFDNTGGTITGGSTIVAPVYQNYAPAHAAGKHWINMDTRVVQVSNGSIWTAVQRVFVGHAVTNTTAVTSFVVYQYNVLRQITAGGVKTGSFTRTLNSESGNQSITGLGFKPSMIKLTGNATSYLDFCSGGFDASSQYVVYTMATNLNYYYNSNANCLFFSYNVSNYEKAAFVSLDSDGFTIAWTKGDAGFGAVTANIYYEAWS